MRTPMKKLFCLAIATAIGNGGCKDQAKQSAASAAQDVAQLVELVGKDIGEVERGLPEGAKRLAPLVAKGADPKQDVAGVRKGLLHVRRDVMDLSIAKSTFFALADPSGIAIRNDLEEDVMAGQNLATIFPALAKATDGYVATTGGFPNASPKPAAPATESSLRDEDWIAAVPVKREDGSTGALFVTGWTYRYFARHLQESLKDKLTDQVKATHDEHKLPVFYVAVFDKTGVYSAPLTPAVDEKALGGRGPPGKDREWSRSGYRNDHRPRLRLGRPAGPEARAGHGHRRSSQRALGRG